MGGKKITGRKRHILVDTMGNLLAAGCHAADINDRVGARHLLAPIVGRFPRLERIWADQGYSGPETREWVWDTLMVAWEVVERPKRSHTFEVLPRRWVVERSLAHLGRSRRLAKDYEKYPATTVGIIWSTEMARLLKHVTRAS